MNDKKFENVLSGKSFWYKEIIFGIIFLIIVFVGSAQVDKKAAKSQVNSTISYVKTQCSIYARYNDATETKTLMRVIVNTQQVNRDIEFCGSELDVEALKKYASEQRLTGIIVMDENGKVVDKNAKVIEVPVDIDKIAATAVVVLNKAGTELPSTGGMGTTVFYVLGSVLVLGAGVLLVTKKRMSDANR